MQIPKIKDKLTLGVIAGLGANIPKSLLCALAGKMGWIEITCPQRAASLLVRKKQLKTPAGKVVGYITDNILAGLLGIGYTYGLTVSGKNNAVIKGAFWGLPSWLFLTATSSVMGVKDPRLSPKTVLIQFIISGVHGAASCYLTTILGDDRIFADKIS